MSGEPDAGTDFIRYSNEAPFQYSDKLGDGIILVRGDSLAEFVEHMVDVFGQEGTDARLLGFASKVGSGDVIQQAQNNLNNAGVTTEPAPSNSTAKMCKHGAMTRRTGTSSKGAWTGYFCPLQKGDPNQCKPVFV